MRPNASLATALTMFLSGASLAALAACQGSRAAAGRSPGAPATVDALAAELVLAIHKNDTERALRLIPSPNELKGAGLSKHATETGHARLVTRARKHFAQVVAKHQRKNPQGCKQLVFSRVVLGTLERQGSLSIYSSIDVFAKCDGREIWIADPDGIFQSTGGWRLLEIS